MLHNSQFNILYILLKNDIKISLRNYLNKIINVCVNCFISFLIAKEIYKFQGINNSFDMIQLTGSIMSIIAWQLFGHLSTFLGDLYGAKNINYELTLPLSPIYILLKYLFLYAFNGLILIPWVLIVGKFMFYDKFIFTNCNWFGLIFVILLSSLVCAAFTLVFNGWVDGFHQIENAIVRFYMPCWMCGFQFSFYTIQNMYPTMPQIAYITLLSPFMSITESIRACMILDGNFLPLKFTIIALCLWIIGLFSLSYYLLSKKLKFVQ